MEGRGVKSKAHFFSHRGEGWSGEGLKSAHAILEKPLSLVIASCLGYLSNIGLVYMVLLFPCYEDVSVGAGYVMLKLN